MRIIKMLCVIFISLLFLSAGGCNRKSEPPTRSEKLTEEASQAHETLAGEIPEAKETVSAKFSEVKEAVSDEFSDAKEAVTEEATKAKEAAAQKVTESKEAAAEKVTEAKEGIQKRIAEIRKNPPVKGTERTFLLVPSDAKATYYILDRTGNYPIRTILTERESVNGLSFTKRECNCSNNTYKEIFSGETAKEIEASKDKKADIIYGSRAFYVCEAACKK